MDNHLLHELLNEKKWNEAMDLLKSNDDFAHTQASTPNKTNIYPLHVACERAAPDDLIIELVKIFADAALKIGNSGNLPLHIATEKNLSVDVIDVLIRVFPEGLDQQNDKGDTPRDIHHDDIYAYQSLARPTCCWYQLIDDETREEDQDRRLDILQSHMNVSLGQISNCNINLDNILQRLEVVERKVRQFQDIRTRGLDKRVGNLEKEYISDMRDLDYKLSRLENEVRCENVKECMAEAAFRTDKDKMMSMQSKSGARAERLSGNIEEIKVRMQVEQALNIAAKTMHGKINGY